MKRGLQPAKIISGIPGGQAGIRTAVAEGDGCPDSNRPGRDLSGQLRLSLKLGLGRWKPRYCERHARTGGLFDTRRERNGWNMLSRGSVAVAGVDYSEVPQRKPGRSFCNHYGGGARLPRARSVLARFAPLRTARNRHSSWSASNGVLITCLLKGQPFLYKLRLFSPATIAVRTCAQPSYEKFIPSGDGFFRLEASE